jgi:hypothetical protein
MRSGKEAYVADPASSGKGDFGKRLAHNALMPIVATAASAAAGYVAKKGPSFFEERVLPKLKEVGDGVGSATSAVPARAKQVAGNAGDLAEGLTSRAKETVGGSGNGHRRGALSQSDLDRHVKERAEARAKRRKAVQEAG